MREKPIYGIFSAWEGFLTNRIRSASFAVNSVAAVTIIIIIKTRRHS